MTDGERVITIPRSKIPLMLTMAGIIRDGGLTIEEEFRAFM
jgi:hypothetical protein